MVTRAILRYIRIAPRKFRQVIPLVKGRNPEEAIAILTSVKKGASKYAIDLIKSAIANAKRKQGVDVANLYISRLIADCGPTLKRYRASSMGRASPILKRTSHLTVELDEAKPQNRKAAKSHITGSEKQAKAAAAPKAERAQASKKAKVKETKEARKKE